MRTVKIMTLMLTALLWACSPDRIDDIDNGTGDNTESGSTDSGSTDSGSTDSGSTDSGSTDSGSTDSGSTDSGYTSITDIAGFDIAIDKSALTESETIPSSESDELYEDYIENNTFSNEVTITFNGTKATYTTVDGVSISTSGADVVVTSTVKKVKYTVTGSTSDGFLKIYSDYKFALSLSGVSITNPNGAPLNIQSKKRGYIILADGTSNTLTDGTSYSDATSDEDMKAAFFSEGKLLFSGSGSLSVYGNCKAGVRSDDYILFRPGNNVYVKATAGNAIKANDAIYIRGGVINAETSATAAKAISSDGIIVIDGGRTTALTTGGGELDEDGTDVSGCAGIKADSTFVINAGSVFCKSTGAGGKGISVDQTLTVNGGAIRVITTGKQYTYGRYDTSAKGIKSDGDMVINDGDIVVRCTGGEGSEGIESKATMTVNGGTIQAYCYDDCLNSSSHMYLKGGTLTVVATGNDGLDSNGNMYISGGTIMAFGTSAPECGIDANEEGGYSVFFTGGTLLAVGGGNSVPSSSSSTQAYVSGTSSVTSGSTVALKSGSTTLATFTVPSYYGTSTKAPGGGGPGGNQGGPGGGGNSGYGSSSVLITCPGLSSGSSYSLVSGSSTTSVTATLRGSSGGRW